MYCYGVEEEKKYRRQFAVIDAIELLEKRGKNPPNK
jgi:hypothetical protein